MINTDYKMVISKNMNPMFYSEAYRASTIEEINESAGLKYLIGQELTEFEYHVKTMLMSQLSIEIIELGRGEFALSLKEKG